MLFLWQVVQAWVVWSPASGNVVFVLWLKLAGFQAASENLWQVSQVVGKPEAAWGGLTELAKDALWHV
jgi:hypothetical protein